MANITLMGASYTDVPAIDLPKTGGGTVRFYENGGGIETVTIWPEQTVTATTADSSGYVIYLDGITENLIADTNYIVTIDGTSYLCYANTIYSDIYAGDVDVVWGNPANAIYPFAIGSYANNRTQWMVADNSPHTVKIERVVSMSGGGGASLPSIISKIDGGSFTPTSDQNTSIYSISHNLGIAPTGAVIWATNITYESYASRAVDMLQMTDARWSLRQVNTNGAARMTYGKTTSGDLGASSFKFTLTSNVYKSGVTYRWLVWA